MSTSSHRRRCRPGIKPVAARARGGSPVHTLGIGIGAGRAVLGTMLLAAPVAGVRTLGLDTATARRVSWLTRMTGVRDAAMGIGTVVTTARGSGAKGWLLAGAAADAADALVIAAALRQGRVHHILSASVVALAAASACTGVLAAAGQRGSAALPDD